MPVGSLDQHAGGRRDNLGGRPSHHACQGNRARRVGHDDVAGCQRAFHPVQGLQPLTLLGPPEDDLAAGYGIRIECMDRVTELPHHVVGHVHHVGDGPLPDSQKPQLHPKRRGTDPHAVHLVGNEARARFRIADRHFEGRGLRAGREARGDVTQRDLPVGGQLAGQSPDAHAVAPIGGDAHVKHHVAQADHLLQGAAQVVLGGRAQLVQDQDAVVVIAQPELAGRGDHAVRYDAAYLATPHLERLVRSGAETGSGPRVGDDRTGLEVPRPAHHVPGDRSVINPAETDPVSIGMRPDLLHSPHHYALEGRSVFLNPLYLVTEGDEDPLQFVRIPGRQIDEIREPANRNLHRNCPRTRRSLS